MAPIHDKIVYLDTNIFSHLAKNKNLWPTFLNFIDEGNMLVALSASSLYELVEANRLYDSIAEFLRYFPSAIIKTSNEILREELDSHPLPKKISLFSKSISNLNEVLNILESGELMKLRSKNMDFVNASRQILGSLKNNYPLAESGRYELSQADEYSSFMVIQSLGLELETMPFLRSFKDHVEELNTDVFLSLRMSAYLIFYKYYIANRNFKDSDYGDLMHMNAIPYCTYFITERDLCNVLNQIKAHHNILEEVTIKNIDFFKYML